MEYDNPLYLDPRDPIRFFSKEKLNLDGISIFAFFLFLSWILLSVFWIRRNNPEYLLWFCDVALLMTSVGLFLRSGIFITAQLTAILVFHLGWNLDFWFYLIFDFLPIGSTAYMFYNELTLFEKSLSFFNHVFIIPIAILSIYILGTSKKAWLFQWVQTSLIFLLTYIFTRPEDNINWIFGTEIFNITPTTIQPTIYYGLLIIVLPLIIYWPTNKLLIFFINRWNKNFKLKTIRFIKDPINIKKYSQKSQISPLVAIAAMILFAIVSVGASYLADSKCGSKPTIFHMTDDYRSSLELIPLSSLKTRIDCIVFGEADNVREVPLFVFHSNELPKQWSGFDNKWHVHTKSLLQYVKVENIPAVPQEIKIHGIRSINGSIVWAFVASDDFYIQDKYDIHKKRKTFEVQCSIGGRGISEYVNPLNGELYESTPYNEILGNGMGAIYVVGVIEIFNGKVSSKSPFYLVKRKGILFPEDICFANKGGSLSPLLSNPNQPTLSKVLFLSPVGSKNLTMNFLTCNFFGYEIRNFIFSREKINEFSMLSEELFNELVYMQRLYGGNL